jgi:hypothetical protein
VTVLLTLLINLVGVALACLAVRYAMPVLVQAGQRALLRMMLALVAAFLLPELIYTRAVRRSGGRVHRAAYDYGVVVAVGACWARDGLGFVSARLARACAAVHPLIVGVGTAALLLYLAAR